MSEHFMPLLIVTLLAFFVPLLLSRARFIPLVVGEILAGIIIGPSLLHWVDASNHTLSLLAEIGFAFLMFLSGLEIDFNVLLSSRSERQRKGNPFKIGGLIFLLTLVLAWLVSEGFYKGGFIPDPWMMTLILSTTSLGIVVPVLKERGLLITHFGQVLLVSALLADFLTMFLITVYVAVHTSGLEFDILLIVLLFVPLIAAYVAANRHLQHSRLWRLLEDMADATTQIKVRGAFAVMMVFVVLAESLGVELILGAFLGGVLLALINQPGDESAHHKLDAIGYGFFIPLFFIDVGIQFDLQAFLHSPTAWVVFPLMLLAAFAIKLAAALVLRSSFSWRETLAGGALLSARLSLIVAASAIGLRLGVIDEAVNASIVLTAAVTASLSPLFFNLLTRKEGIRQAAIRLIYGANDLALQTGQYLQAHGDRVYIYAPVLKTQQRILEAGLDLLPGSDKPLVEALEALDSDFRIQTLIALCEDDDRNLEACRQAGTHGITHVVAFSQDPQRLPDYRQTNAQVITSSLYRAAMIGLLSRTPAFFSLLTTTTDDKDVVDIELTNPALDGKALQEIQLPASTLVLAIRRGDEFIVPRGHTRLQKHDRISLMGKTEDVGKLIQFLT